ncbi:hypothetical protein GCM10009528_06960 [Kineococcus aurantiacus]
MRVVTEREQGQGRQVRSVERWRTVQDHEAVAEALREVDADPGLPWSFDLLSTAAGTSPRFIEVKGRGTKGPVDVIDREYNFAARLGEHAVLAVVWYAEVSAQQQVWVASDWTRLPWQRTREADPKRAEDSAFLLAFGMRDKRSRSQRALEAEGERSLTNDDVEAHGRMVQPGV